METRLVYGMLDAGKTTYIRGSIESDPFWKYGRTLILCFESGEEEYDEDMLAQKNTVVEYFEGGGDITAFCAESIQKHNPDRVYVEMNQMIAGLKDSFPEIMEVRFRVTIISADTLELYLGNLRQYINDMVKDSDTVIFRQQENTADLSGYSQLFRLMNSKAVYLREDPMGYHERAFEMFLPYSLEGEEICIREEYYIAFCLDMGEHPEHYEGKRIRFTLPLEVRTDRDGSEVRCGRTVMTCCMADIQFMGSAIKTAEGGEVCPGLGGWISLTARGKVGADSYGTRRLELIPLETENVKAPSKLMLSA